MVPIQVPFWRRLRRPWKKKGIGRGLPAPQAGSPAPRQGDCVPLHPLLHSYEGFLVHHSLLSSTRLAK